MFALAGLGCSALLPLTISLGQGALPRVSAAVAGGVIACYQVGYGVAAFGVGPLVDHGVLAVRPLRLDRGRGRRHGAAVVRDHACQEGVTPCRLGVHRTIVELSRHERKR